MNYGRQRMKSSFTIICETDTFILIRDNDDPEYASVTNAAEFTVETLAQSFDLTNRRVLYLDTMQRFDELCHDDGKFTGFKALTQSQQQFFGDLLENYGSTIGATNV
ncbi:MAG: hypothetical protein GY774_28750 [Planctomycetes bacterium]|nr:hypothetical protein [Planctomycetota bacterium]